MSRSSKASAQKGCEMKRPSGRRAQAEEGAIAVIGMACRFAGADHYLTFWDNLQNGRCGVREIPADRWNVAECYSPDLKVSGKSYCKWGGFLSGIERFDADFFGISAAEAGQMDPQQRMLLEETYHCIEDAGFDPEELRNRRVSLHVGLTSTDYRLIAAAHPEATDAFSHSGSYGSVLGNRILYALGLKGYGVVLDAACASSLVALHEAKCALRDGRSDYALAAGVTLSCHPWKYIAFAKAKLLSADGVMRPFDRRADGFVPGEGVGVVLLERLDEAIARGHFIYGVLKGSAVFHGGYAAALSSPDADTQRRVVLDAWLDAGVNPESITYIETHGAAGLLSDAVELDALDRAFREHTGRTQFCRLGSVKPHIGHTEAAAGMAGLIKVLLMMRFKKILPLLNFQDANPMIRFAGAPFMVPTEPLAWKNDCAPAPLRAGISAFGLAGTNAHLVVEAFEPHGVSGKLRPAVAPNGRHLFLVSAKTAASLRTLLDDWRKFTENGTCEDYAWSDVCATLLGGREAFACRVGGLLENREELKNFLNQKPEPCLRAAPGPCGIKIESVWFEGGGPFKALALHNPLFNRHWAETREFLSTQPGGRNLATVFNRRKWPRSLRSFFSILAMTAYVRTLVDLGIRPAFVTGEKNGWWVGLLVCGIVSPEDCRRVFTGKSNGSLLKPMRPSLPFYDPVAKQILRPFRFSPEYLELLTRDLDITEEEFLKWAQQVKALGATQASFRKYLQTFIPFPELFNAAPFVPRTALQRVLAAGAMVCALGRLHAVWGLAAPKPAADKRFFELLDLLLDRVLPLETFARYAEQRLDAEALAGILDQNRENLDLRKPYELLRGLNRDLAGMEPFNDRSAEALSGAQAGSAGKRLVFCRADENKKIDFMEPCLCVDLEKEITAEFDRALLFFWLDGANIRRQALTPPAGHCRLPLPTYAFDRRAFWLPVDGLQQESAAGRPAAVERVAGQGLRLEPADLSFPALKQWLEKRILEMVREISAADASPIAAADKFFDSGIHSINIAALAEKIRTDLDIPIAVTDLFSYPSVQALTGHILRNHRAALKKSKNPFLQQLIAGFDASSDAVRSLLSRESAAPATAGERAIRASVIPDARTGNGDAAQAIAVIGMAGRFPDAETPEEFWQNLAQGRDSVRELPRERWDIAKYYDPDHNDVAKTYCKWGGSLKDIDCFDASFFKMSEREAELADPQQRLFLEECWKALENAGYADSVPENPCGVFIGVMHGDYDRQLNAAHVAMETFRLIGTDVSFLGARIAYLLDLKGPSLSVNTACSSALAAVHLACRSLAAGECTMALAGGVAVRTSLDLHMACSNFRQLSPTGKCRAFDEQADGFVLSEGVGVLVLKPLQNALADRDHIYGVIRGSGINHDGSTISLTAPSALSQKALLRSVYRQNGMQPDRIDYVEAHGAGTQLGDPIEMEALNTVFKEYGVPNQSCAIGSVKTNIGHPAAASGIAGLMKVLLALKNKQIPPSLNFTKANSFIDFEQSPFFVNTQLREWKARDGRPRRAAINSFGLSGTNVHAVIEEAPPAAEPFAGQDRPLHIVTLSAKDSPALAERARQMAAYLGSDRTDAHLGDIGYSLNAGRTHFNQRLAVIGASRSAIQAKLADFLNNKANPDVHHGVAVKSAGPEVVFLFGTHPPCGTGYCFSLYRTLEPFRNAVEACEAFFKQRTGQSLVSRLQTAAQPEQTGGEPDYAATVHFCIQYALYRVWSAWGIKPGAAAGAGTGEYMAGLAAGVLTLEQALTLVFRFDEKTVAAAPAAVVASGGTDCSAPLLPLFCGRTARRIQTVEELGPAYWDSVTSETNFRQELFQTLRKEKYSFVLNIGLDHTLFPESLHSGTDEGPAVLACLDPAREEWSQLLPCLARLYVGGFAIDWKEFDRPFERRRLPLPTYPFRQKRYWVAPREKPASDQDPPRAQSLDTEALQALNGGFPMDGLVGMMAAQIQAVSRTTSQVIAQQLAFLGGSRSAEPELPRPAKSVNGKNALARAMNLFSPPAWRLLTVEAQSKPELDEKTAALTGFLAANPDSDWEEVQGTRTRADQHCAWRRAVLCQSVADALQTLKRADPEKMFSGACSGPARPVTFMFAGLGDHYINMAAELYRQAPYFREQMDSCLRILAKIAGRDFRKILYPDKPLDSQTNQGLDLRKMLLSASPDRSEERDPFFKTQNAHPLLFSVEYCLAQMLQKAGAAPQALIGHSLGEYAAACVAGVFSLESALLLVTRRAQLIEALPQGAMLTIPLAEQELLSLLPEGVSIAIINAPALCTVAGPEEAVAELERRLAGAKIVFRRPAAAHAFHSPMVAPMREPFRAVLKTIEFRAPQIPFISSMTGTWIEAAQAIDPDYWVEHTCRAVRFSDGIETLLKTSDRILIEIGPGQSLGSFVWQHPAAARAKNTVVFSILRHVHDPTPDEAVFLGALSRLWTLNGL